MIVILLFFYYLFGETIYYYLDGTNGNDENECSSTEPCKTISPIALKINKVNGDYGIIFSEDGEYSGASFLLTDYKKLIITGSNNKLSGNPAVKISHSTTSTSSYLFSVSNSAVLSISNIFFSFSGGSGTTYGVFFAPSSTTKPQITCTYCSFTRPSSTGFFIQRLFYVII
jgi:hypothetical protein